MMAYNTSPMGPNIIPTNIAVPYDAATINMTVEGNRNGH